MERLTFTDLELEMSSHDCTVKIFDKTVENLCDKVCEEFQYNCPFDKLGRKLKAYEDTGLTPEQILDMDEEYTKLAKELGEYKRLEEQGLLIKLPCKVGDTVYYIDDGEIYWDKVYSIDLRKEKGEFVFCIGCMDYKEDDFGKIAFTSKEEAEKALAEMGE